MAKDFFDVDDGRLLLDERGVERKVAGIARGYTSQSGCDIIRDRVIAEQETGLAVHNRDAANRVVGTIRLPREVNSTARAEARAEALPAIVIVHADRRYGQRQ